MSHRAPHATLRNSRSSFDGRDSHHHLDLDSCAHALTAAGAALHPALRLPDPAAGGPDDYPTFVWTAADIDARVRHLLPVLASTDAKKIKP